MRWEISENEIYALCVAQVGGAVFVDRALAAIVDALSRNPLAFPETGVSEIRIAKTKLVWLGTDVVPALTLRFRVSPPHSVELLHLELSPPEDMEIVEDTAWPE